MKKLLRDILFVGFFLLTILIYFYQTIFMGKVPIPSDSLVGLYHPWRDYYATYYPRGIPYKNFLITDPVRQQIPWRKVAIESWRDGQIPGWNPYVFSGAPLLGNIQAAAVYPLNFIFFLLPLIDAWTILIIFQPLLGGLFLYIYLRFHKFAPESSLFGAISWSLCGYSIAWITWGTVLHVSLWLPLILLSLEQIIYSLIHENKKMKILWSLLLIVATSLQIFAGHAQISIYLLGLASLYCIIKIIRLSTHKLRLRAMTLFLFLGMVVFFVTLIQTFPFFQTILESGRIDEASRWLQEGWFLPWEHLVQFIIPDFFGNPATLNYWGKWNYGEFVGYIGTLPFLFALYSFGTNKTLFWKFYMAVCIVVLLFLLPTPLAELPYRMQVPFWSSMQPTRLIFLLDFSLVILATHGFDTWLKNGKKIFRPALLYFVAMGSIWLVVTMLSQSISSASVVSQFGIAKRNLLLPTAFLFLGSGFILLANAVSVFYPKYKVKTRYYSVFALLILTSLDLIRFGWKFTPFSPKEYFFTETKSITFLKNQPQPFRVFVLDNRIMPPNVLAFYGIESVEGYDPVFTRKYEEFIAASERGSTNISPPYGFNRIVTPHNIGSSLVPYLNAKYVISLGDIHNSFLKKVYEEGQTQIYEDTRALPRVYLADTVRTQSSKIAVLQDLYTFQEEGVENAAVVEGHIQIEPTHLEQNEGVEIVEYEPQHMRLSTMTNTQRLLVIGNSYNSHWQATIDGLSVSILPTNYLFQGLIVPEGSHVVELQYKIF